MLTLFMADHFEPAMGVFRLTFEAIGDALRRKLGHDALGCAFEDFLSQRFRAAR